MTTAISCPPSGLGTGVRGGSRFPRRFSGPIIIEPALPSRPGNEPIELGPVFAAIQLRYRDVFLHTGQPVLPQSTAPGQLRFAVAAMFPGSALRVISKSENGGTRLVRERKEKARTTQIPPLPLHYVQGPVAKTPLGEVARPGDFAIPRAERPWDLPCWPARLG